MTSLLQHQQQEQQHQQQQQVFMVYVRSFEGLLQQQHE